ncbi:aspartate aminotransferase family protein [Marinibaculum pumilum]|uniref:Aspartate aminotransferase family protein n=1 Tax=Marinibaculum pumilum TaxID=1766165 RepID=A0ABV7L9N1_9PROT
MNIPAHTNSLEAYWLPFTANRHFKKAPRLLARAEGMYYWNHRGEQLIDGCAGLFTSALGHCRPEIAAAVADQLGILDFSPPFQFANPLAFELAAMVAEITPEGLNHVFFTGGGSESVETAMKIALAWHRVRGQSQRQRFVGRERAYHGVNFGGVSIGGMVKNRESYGIGLPGVAHMRHTWLDENRFLPGQGPAGAELAEDLQRIVDLHGADQIAACFVEPIAGSTGVLVPPQGYLQRLREICDAHGILLVFDEVICGFGRTGAAFGAQSFGVTPDIITMAKALTNGAVPMGAVAVKDEIYDAVTGAVPEGGIELFHGYTYSAHPAACAAGIATQRIYREERTFEGAAALAPRFLDRVFALRDLDAVTDIRGYGLLAGIDLAPAQEAGRPKPGARGYAVLQAAYEAGLVVRVTMDTVILAPALVAEDAHLDEIVDKLRRVIAAS